MENLSENTAGSEISSLFNLFSQPAHIQILMIIREQPACVCHLAAALGLRQASISQHLMILQKAGWVSTRRDSCNIYYSLTDDRSVQLVDQAAELLKLSKVELKQMARRPLYNCLCP